MPLTATVRKELDKLSRYCGSSYGYSYSRYPSYSSYPSNGYSNTGSGSGFNLGSLIGYFFIFY